MFYIKLLTVSSLLVLSNFAVSQTQINGYIYNKRHQPVAGASVIVSGNFKATLTDSLGKFRLSELNNNNDTIRLRVSSLGYEIADIVVVLPTTEQLIQIVLTEKIVVLKDVVISVGSFEASEEKKTTILKPFDIATTPTASPDAFKAIEQLPGTTKVGESAGLFVRGGDAVETKAVIDGLMVQDPFFSSVPGVAQQGRFSPLMFKGTSFSTGGYSVQYGQALSSVLLLTSQDVAGASSSSIVLSTAGVNGNITRKWKQTSMAVNANYYNLRPSFSFNKQNFNYKKAPETGGGNIMFRNKGRKNDLFKLYASYQLNNVELQIPYISTDGNQFRYDLKSDNLYLNSTYKAYLKGWQLNTGVSFSYNKDDAIYDSLNLIKKNSRSQARMVFTKTIRQRTKLYIGSELQYVWYQNKSRWGSNGLNDWLLATFAETEFYVGNKIAARTGLRNEISITLSRMNLAPRISLAYVFNKYAQLSIAYGDFYQLPAETYLFTNRNLRFERASHYIINYQFVRNNRTFRIEAYYKDYTQLIKEPDSVLFEPFTYGPIPSSNTNNRGRGYARGIDVFWYDKATLKGFDYWVSYSFLDTKRFYQNFPGQAMPTFAARHNISVVAKYSIPKTTLNIGFTYNYTSGRPYYNPNHAFLSDKTPPVHNLIFSGNYSWFQKNNLFAVFAYIDNILGIKNVYNYFFSPDGLQQYTLRPPAYRSIYAGINITLAKKRTIMGINL